MYRLARSADHLSDWCSFLGLVSCSRVDVVRWPRITRSGWLLMTSHLRPCSSAVRSMPIHSTLISVDSIIPKLVYHYACIPSPPGLVLERLLHIACSTAVRNDWCQALRLCCKLTKDSQEHTRQLKNGQQCRKRPVCGSWRKTVTTKSRDRIRCWNCQQERALALQCVVDSKLMSADRVTVVLLCVCVVVSYILSVLPSHLLLVSEDRLTDFMLRETDQWKYFDIANGLVSKPFSYVAYVLLQQLGNMMRNSSANCSNLSSSNLSKPSVPVARNYVISQRATVM